MANEISREPWSTSERTTPVDDLMDSHAINGNDNTEQIGMDFERNIMENLDIIASNPSHLPKTTGKSTKYKKIETMKELMQWIKYVNEKVDKHANIYKLSAILTESNKKLAYRLSLNHECVNNTIKEVKQLSKNFDDFKSVFGKKLSDIDNSIGSFQTTDDKVEDRFKSLETNFKSLEEEFTDKLLSTERRINNDNNFKNNEFNETINILCESSELAMKKINELSDNFDTLSSKLELLENEMSEMKSEIRANEIQVKKNFDKCVGRDNYLEEKLEKSEKLQHTKNEDLSDSVRDARNNLESDYTKQINTLADNFNGLLNSFKNEFNEVQQRMNNKLKLQKSNVKNNKKIIDELKPISDENQKNIVSIEEGIGFKKCQIEYRERLKKASDSVINRKGSN